jgi:Spy/CpxP family protein refolding chaperone
MTGACLRGYEVMNILKLFLSSTIALSILVSSGHAFSAGVSAPAGKWWRNQSVIQSLNLSREEVDKLDAAFRGSRKKLIELKSRVEIEQFELETLIENRTLNESDLLSQHQKLEKARTALGMERFSFFIKVRKIVGYEKFQQLMMLKKKRKHIRRKPAQDRQFGSKGQKIY